MLADGHGPNGHFASKFCCENIMNFLEQWISSHKDDELTDEKIKEFLKASFEQTHAKMQSSEEDIRFYKYSGTTMIVAIVRKCTLYIANLGDSKALLGSQGLGKLVPSMVTNDHKPDDPVERRRIEEAGGIVKSYREEDGSYSGPARVWNKNETEPGLATSRSLGDLLAHKLGVSYSPGIVF